MYELGLVSISFRQHSPEEIVREAKRAGLTCVEWGSDSHAPFNEPEKLREIVRLQKEYGITCSSYGTYFKFGITPIEELEQYISAAKILGTDVVRVWCGGHKGGSAQYTEQDMKELIAECIEADKIAKAHDVRLCLECHPWTFTDTKESALRLMQAVDSPNFRMYWQPNQCVSVEENRAYARLLAPYTENIHVFCWDENSRYPLSEGIEVWNTYLSCFQEQHRLLLEFMPDDRLETLQREANTLKEMVGRSV